MQLAPLRQPHESLAAFRCRYARFSLACSGIFGLALGCLVLIAPSVNESGAPIVLMVLYVGLPLVLGVSVLATVGFAIGAVSTRLVARVPAAINLKRRVGAALSVVFFTPMMLYCAHLVMTGLAEGRIPLFARSRYARPIDVTPDDAGWYLFSIVGFSAFTALFLWLVLRGVHGVTDPNAHQERVRRRLFSVPVNLRILAAFFACFGLMACCFSYQVALEHESAMSRYPLLGTIIDAYGRWSTLLVLCIIGAVLLRLAYRSHRLASELRRLEAGGNKKAVEM